MGLALAAALLCGRLAVAGENWPQFRGPGGQGLSNERGVPSRWGGPDQENVRWKTALPANINNPFSSPIVWGDKVVITTAKDKPPREQHVLCYRLSDGAALWDTPVPLGPWKGGSNNGYPTPATDGRDLCGLRIGGHRRTRF